MKVNGLWSLIPVLFCRLSFVQPSYHNIQKILAVRRTILQATGIDSLRHEVGQCWLKAAKSARKANHLQTAYSYLLKSEPYDPLELPREQAKFLWAKGDAERAISYLDKATQNPQWLTAVKRRTIHAQTKLLLARYLDESKSLQSVTMTEKFKEVVELAPRMEKSHFYLGQYYDKVSVLLSGISDHSINALKFELEFTRKFDLRSQNVGD